MKKNLILFLIFFCTNIITTPTKCAPSRLPGDRVTFTFLSNTLEFDGGGYHKIDNCGRETPNANVKSPDPAFLHTPEIEFNKAAYVATNQNTKCTNGTQIYIKTPSGISASRKSETPQCWEASVKPTGNGLFNRQWKQCQNIPNCERQFPDKWYSNQNRDKVPVFVNNAGEVILYEGAKLPSSLIIKYNDSTTVDLACIGYACKTGNIYTYGCQDGSCTPGCPDDDDNNGDDDGGGGGSYEPERTLPDPPAPPKDPEPDFDNVVKPYLDLLGD